MQDNNVQEQCDIAINSIFKFFQDYDVDDVHDLFKELVPMISNWSVYNDKRVTEIRRYLFDYHHNIFQVCHNLLKVSQAGERSIV